MERVAASNFRKEQARGRSLVPTLHVLQTSNSVLPSTTDKDGHEQDCFDGIDTSLPGLQGDCELKNQGAVAAAGLGWRVVPTELRMRAGEATKK